MKEPAKNEKVTETAMTRSIIASVIGIVLCMACLFGTTWAWYSSSVTSGVSVTEGANFDFSVKIIDNVDPDDHGVYHFESGPHTVKLTKAGTATKGFCKVVANKSGEEAEATTIYYIIDFTGKETISFTVKGSGTLKLTPMWGTPTSEYTVIPLEGITLKPDPVAMTSPPKTEIQPDETVPPTDGEPEKPEEITTDETPANPEQTEPETQTEPEPTEPISEIPPETTTQE